MLACTWMAGAPSRSVALAARGLSWWADLPRRRLGSGSGSEEGSGARSYPHRFNDSDSVCT